MVRYRDVTIASTRAAPTLTPSFCQTNSTNDRIGRGVGAQDTPLREYLRLSMVVRWRMSCRFPACCALFALWRLPPSRPRAPLPQARHRPAAAATQRGDRFQTLFVADQLSP